MAGRTNTISGEGGRTIRCVAGTKVPFSVLVTPEYGQFTGGSALVSADAYREVYTETETSWNFHWDGASTEQEMKLTR